jgi:arylformamidase
MPARKRLVCLPGMVRCVTAKGCSGKTQTSADAFGQGEHPRLRSGCVGDGAPSLAAIPEDDMSGLAPADLEAEYNNRARVPEYPQIMAGWERDAAAYRQARRHRAETGLRYGPHPRQTIDIFHADAPEDAAPLVVFIHGGYWRSLEPSLFSHMAAGANSHGYSVAIPGYRLCPEVDVATIVEDVRHACRFLHDRLGKKLVGCGHSAGGHLTAAMAATDWAGLDKAVPGDLLRRGLAVSGVFDLVPLISTSINETLHLDRVGAERASPAFWPVPPGVELDLFVGETESAEFVRQSRDMADSWSAAGARTSLAIVPGSNHFDVILPLADPASSMTEALVALCRRHAKLERRALDPRPPLP